MTVFRRGEVSARGFEVPYQQETLRIEQHVDINLCICVPGNLVRCCGLPLSLHLELSQVTRLYRLSDRNLFNEAYRDKLASNI